MEPRYCHYCQKRSLFELNDNRSSYKDKQYIRIQENGDGDDFRHQTPLNINLIVYDGDVNFVSPGEQVSVIGIYRAQPIRISRNKTSLKTVFRNYIDVVTINYLKRDHNKRLTEFTFKEKKMFR